MLEYTDASGQIYTEDQINKMAAEQKTSASAIIKSKRLTVKKQKERSAADLLDKFGGAGLKATYEAPKTKSFSGVTEKGGYVPDQDAGYSPKKKTFKKTKRGIAEVDTEAAYKKFDDAFQGIDTKLKNFQKGLVKDEATEDGEYKKIESLMPKKPGDFLVSTLADDDDLMRIFGAEEEEGVSHLRTLYRGIPGLTFEETNISGIPLFGRADISNQFDAVKAIYTDPKTGKRVESTPIQFDINFMNTGADEKSSKLNANKTILKNFFEQNLKNVDLGKNQYIKNKLAGIADVYVNAELTPNVILDIENKYNAPDLFDKKTIVKQKSLSTAKEIDPNAVYTETILPYQQELKQSSRQILYNNPGISKSELDVQSKALTREVLVQKEINNRRGEIIEKAISKDKSLQSTLLIGAVVEKNKEVAKQNKLSIEINGAIAATNTVKNTFDLMDKAMKGFTYSAEDEKTIIKNLSKLNINVDTRDTTQVQLKNGAVVPSWMYASFDPLKKKGLAQDVVNNNLFKSQNDNLAKLEKTSVFAEAAAKNYDLGEKYLANIGIGITELGLDTAYILSQSTMLGQTNPAIKAKVAEAKGLLDNARQSYTRDVSFEDAFSSVDNFVKFMPQEVSTQIPILLGIIASGGGAGATALIGASTTGNKMLQMQSEVARGEADYSDTEIWLSSMAYGAAEAGFSAISTIPILKRAKSNFIATGNKESIIDNGIKSYFKNKTTGFVADQLLESAGEAGTQITQNIIDGSPVMQNVDHAAFSGFAMGTVLAGTPHFRGAYMSTFATYGKKENIRKLQSEIAELSKDYAMADTPSAKKIIQESIDEASKNIAIEIEAHETLIGNNLRAGAAKAVISIETEKARLQNEAKDILANKDIPQTLKEKKLNDLRNKFEKLQNAKNKVVKPSNLMSGISDLEALETNEPELYAQIFTQAKANVDKKNNGQTTEDQITKEAYEIFLSNRVDKNIEQVSKVEGANVKAFDTKKEAIAFTEALYDTEIAKAKSEEDIKTLELNKTIATAELKDGADGFNALGTQVVVKEAMIAAQRTEIGTHEVGHYALDKIFENNPESFVPIAKQLLKTAKILDKNVYDRITANAEKDANGDFIADEVIARFLEEVSNNKITYASKAGGLAGVFGMLVQKEFSNQYDFDFKGETDMFNFVVGLGKKIKAGTLTLGDIEAAKKSAQNIKATKEKGIALNQVDVKLSKSAEVLAIEKKLVDLDAQFENEEIDYDEYENRAENLEKDLAKAVAAEKAKPREEAKPEVKKKEVVKDDETEVKEIIAESKGSISSDKVQQIYNEKGVEGALDIIKLFGPITKKIVDKRRDAPGFDRELLTDEIETGVGGILDLISKYDPKSGTPLAAYINKYLPVRAITASRRVLDKDFKKDAAEEKGLMATETADSGFVESAKEKPKYKNALESKIFTPEELKTAENKILTVVRTLKNRIDAPISINRTVTPIIAEIRDAMGKQLDIDLKTIMGGKKDGVLRKWLLDHKRYVLENMTTTWLMGADGKGGIPQAIQKKIDGKWVNYPDWVGKKIDREAMSTDNAGRTSGAELARRLPNVFNNVSDADYLGQILEVDGNPIRGRKESLAKAVAEESSFDIITNDLLNEGPIFDALATNQERLGYELLSNSVNEVIKQAERGNVKFSKNLLVELDAKKDLLASNISINGRPSLRNIKAAIGITFPKWNGEEITNVANALIPNLTLAFKQVRQTKRTKPVDLFTKAISNVVNDLDTGTIMSIKFGSPMSVAKFFRTPEMVADLKTMDRNFSIAVIKKFGEKSGFDLLNSLWKPTVAGKTSAGAISIYKGVDDFTNNLESIKKELNYEGEITSNNKKANKVFKNHFDGTYDYKRDKQKSEAAWELGTFAAEWFSNEINNPENNYGAQHLAALYTLLIKENDSVLRSAAPVSGVITDKRIKELNKYDYDHSKPVSYVARRLADKFVYNKEVDLDLLKKDYEVNIIPKTVSSKLTRSGLKSMMPLDYTEGAGSYLRISQATAAIVDKYEKFAETVNKNEQNLSNALMKQSFSKAQKGISVFDFDDTTGITKGNVLYTMPDSTTGKLNAEEFAKEGSRLLAEGAEFDFSEFSKVVDGKPGPMVEKMKKMIGKFGPENFFILTARPQAAAVPIHEFLSSMSIDIPLENITGLGNSTGQAKADWMVAKAAEGYNDFYFADDAIQNVTAVKEALDVLDVKSKIQQAKAKFSLTSRQDLKWGYEVDSSYTRFEVNGKGYMILLNDASQVDYNDELDKNLEKLIKKYNINLINGFPIMPGNTYELIFEANKGGGGITGQGDAAEVFGIVINGVIDYIKNNNVKNIVFTAKEPSRIKLYDAMANVIANKIGWDAFYENGTYIVSESASNNTINTFANQPKPVKDALNVLDIKSPTQQAKAKFSKSMSDEFNKIIEENKGVESYKVYSDIVAKRRGAGKNRFDLFVPPSAADFELLLYKFMGKGERGEEQQKFFDEALLKPYINGVNLMDGARQSIKKSYKALTKAFPDVQKKLEKLSPDKDFTYDQAIRVALWNDAGIKIPGLTQRDNKKLVEMVNGDPELLAFKEGLKAMSRQEKGWVEPSEYWDTDTIVSDLFNITQSGGRKKFLGEFIENVETIFGKWESGKLVGPNMNKIQAVYGTNVREALEDSLYRMINGKNRSYGQDRETSMWTNWVTGSTGVIMFLNTRSAVLQLLSTANFLNLRDNNPIAAAKAFANQKQYWSDFSTIWNSDKMKERRGGLREDVVASEIANAAAGSKNKAAAVISYLLKIGYTPTQLADSFAISSGGAPYYRNRIKTHISEGMSETEAETLAWEEFSKIADETQQSGDPKDISKQQASGAGRLLLTFQNTAMQQSRLVKKAFLDLKNGRGDVKTNIAKISYYLVIQNTIFSVLQQGLFSVLFDEDEEEAKRNKSKDEKAVDLANGVLDSILRGTGFYGGIAATLKNVAVKYMEQQDKKQKDYAAVVIEAANISPPIGSKLRKLYTGLKQTEYDKDLIKERGWGIMQDGRVHLGPMYSVTGKGAEVLLNVPMDRLVNKIENVSQALNNQNKAWQRAAVALGFTPWTVGIEKPAGDLKIIEEAKAKRKIEGLAKAEITRKEKSKALKDSIKSLTPSERLKYRRSVALEKREIALAKRKKRKTGGD